MFSEIPSSSVEVNSIWRKEQMMSKALLKVLVSVTYQVYVVH